MEFPFQTRKQPKNIFQSFSFKSGIHKTQRQCKGQPHLSVPQPPFTLLWRMAEQITRNKLKNVKKLIQTEAGVALDNSDCPFKVAPGGQDFLVAIA